MYDILKSFWYFVCRYIFVIVPDKYFVQLTAFVTYLRLGFSFSRYDLKNPVSFNEKLTVLKLNPLNKSLSVYADKISVRDYVKKKIGDDYLIPLIKVYTNAHEIDFDKLPESFVLKTNHGSGWNIICENKKSLDYNYARKKLDKWLKYNAFYLTREYQYKPIIPAIICEEFIGKNIYDYKFFCFNGEPQIVQVDIDRFTDHKRVFFDMNWEKKNFSIRYSISEKLINKPDKFDEMKDISRKLSAPFKFVRVDLYYHNSQVYFGELTFFPGGGNEPFNPVEYDYEIGRLLKI